MSEDTVVSPKTSRRRKIVRFLPWLLVLAVIGGIGVIAESQQKEEYGVLDPNSPEPEGTRAMRLLSEQLGAQFEITNAAPQNGTVVVLRDDLDQQETARIDAWVRAGGTLVVADLRSSFAGRVAPVPSSSRGPKKLAPQCNSPVVAGVASIEPDPNRNYSMLTTPPGELAEATCFTDGNQREGFVVVTREGAGRTIVVGDQRIFTNEQLEKADNSVLVANMLDARPGRTVAFMSSRAAPSGGAQGPLDLLPTGARAVLWQLLVAAGALMIWRMRRHGKPVEEPRPVEVPASSLVVATGALRESSGHEAHASQVLRADLRRTACDRFGLPPDADVATIAAVAHQRSGVDEERMRAVLAGSPADSGRSLVELAQEIENVYQEVVRGR